MKWGEVGSRGGKNSNHTRTENRETSRGVGGSGGGGGGGVTNAKRNRGKAFRRASRPLLPFNPLWRALRGLSSSGRERNHLSFSRCILLRFAENMVALLREESNKKKKKEKIHRVPEFRNRVPRSLNAKISELFFSLGRT